MQLDVVTVQLTVHVEVTGTLCHHAKEERTRGAYRKRAILDGLALGVVEHARWVQVVHLLSQVQVKHDSRDADQPLPPLTRGASLHHYYLHEPKRRSVRKVSLGLRLLGVGCWKGSWPYWEMHSWGRCYARRYRSAPPGPVQPGPRWCGLTSAWWSGWWFADGTSLAQSCCSPDFTACQCWTSSYREAMPCCEKGLDCLVNGKRQAIASLAIQVCSKQRGPHGVRQCDETNALAPSRTSSAGGQKLRRKSTTARQRILFLDCPPLYVLQSWVRPCAPELALLRHCSFRPRTCNDAETCDVDCCPAGPHRRLHSPPC